ncbi:enoyl-CoA hydratase [Kurthia huakuii]|uniref:enoyl-CoA hydratase n=1 Tax=Kurthia huakuii TaxID=1421019 RepID=UPI0004956FD8|nr:enoyl-CoA hydratase [Kurthia huakuii]MBM7700901.1 enoyl-CoA hydratase/carnithine racemase [Kurthia huakuii]
MTLVVVEVENHIATITLNRPEAANSMSLAMLHEYKTALETIAHDRTIRVVLLTGAGNSVFCAGADLKERQSMDDIQTRQTVALIGDIIRQTEALPQPVIAVINGVAVGGGLEISLACDLRVASTSAKVGLTETALGIIPGAGGTQRLARLIGAGKAKELIYTARRISAEEALQLGIIEHLYVPELLMSEAKKLAGEMAKNAPLSLIQAKKAIQAGLQTDLATGLEIEGLAYERLLHSEDRLEGLRAFREKRAPQFKGQ